MKKNDLRERADRALSPLQWDERHTLRVLNVLHEKGAKPIMKKKLSIALVMMLILSLLTVGALAVAALNWSPQASAVNQARQALMDKYGLTQETIALFHNTYEKTEDGWKVIFRSGGVHESLAGEYTVTITDHDATAAWSYDYLDKALWENGSLDAPVWGQPQLHSYLHDDTEEAKEINIARWHESATLAPGTAANPTPTPAPADVSESVYTVVEPDQQARDIAASALMEIYPFTEADIAGGEWLDDFVYTQDGRSMRTMTLYLAKDGVEYLCSVDIDMETYAIHSIDASTGGNG